MSNRLKRALVWISMGGMAFAFGAYGWGCQPFAENQPYINFLDDIGDYAIAVGVDNALENLNNADIDNWFNDPVTNLYQRLWSGWVQFTFPQDPTYNTLLVN